MKSLDIRRNPRRKRSAARAAVIPIRIKKAKLPAVSKQRASLETAIPRKTWPKAIASSAGLVVLLLVVFSVLILPEARVAVTVRGEPVTRDFEIRVDQNVSAPTPADLAIPGKIITQEISGTKTFPATGSRNIGRKASGFVTLYNFSKTPLILKAQTTVLAAAGRKYYFTQDVGNIRPTALLGLEQQEVDLTSLVAPVPVAAGAPGPEYNLPAGARLEIENQAFGKQPKLLWATVAENLSGGTNQEVKVASQGDIAQAYGALTKELIGTARQAVTAEKSDLKLLDNAAVAETVEQKTSVSAGADAAEFAATLKVRVSALVYDESQVRAIITERIKRLLPENKALKAGAPETLTASFVNLSLPSGQGVLAAHFEGQIIYRVNASELLAKVRGKTPEEIREILLSRPEIAAVTIKLYPFWVKRVPSFGKKVYLQILEPGA